MTLNDKIIVTDLDDTLCFTTNRDWDNSLPNVELIKKYNDLYDNGWEIHIVTARGQLTCNGDSLAAEKKYRNIIENWLLKHNVKYTSLSFQKKYAKYYVDDKAIKPEDFLKEIIDE